MKTVRLFVLAALLSLQFVSGLSAQSHPKNIKAYLTVSFQGKAIENKEFHTAGIADKISEIITSEGIELLKNVDIGKPGEPCLNIYVTLDDSLRMSAISYEDGGNNSVMSFSCPERSYAYKNTSEIIRSVRKYVKEYIKSSPKKSGK
ncbi:MAG: hypothetical protein HF300_17315 [Ignavibacteria bacterium]|jgi:hypothetical protein|nr:hypothetical protein [Ignavibacteria bacterium]MCU7514321.1 hypothetical protein [Ignavibacteria bacterium]